MSEAILTNNEKEVVKDNNTNPSIQTLKVGLIMPISNTEGYPIGHWNEVRKIIEEALSEVNEYKCEVSMVSEAEDVTLIQKNIIQRIYEDDIVIVDVSSKNPNVMFELGVRLAFDKAFVLLKDDLTDYSFDISSIHHINYPKDLRYKDVIEMKSQLKTRLLATYSKSKSEESMYLKDFGTYKVANLGSTEIPVMDYLQKMFGDMKREIREVKTNKVESKVNHNMHKFNREQEERMLKERIKLIVAEYVANNDIGDGSGLFDEEHEVRGLINSDKIVRVLDKENYEIELVLSNVLDELGYLPF